MEWVTKVGNTVLECKCLNCGHLNYIVSDDIEVDELGAYTVCKLCGASFDIESR